MALKKKKNRTCYAVKYTVYHNIYLQKQSWNRMHHVRNLQQIIKKNITMQNPKSASPKGNILYF